jgi:hypothetical protein
MRYANFIGYMQETANILYKKTKIFLKNLAEHGIIKTLTKKFLTGFSIAAFT